MLGVAVLAVAGAAHAQTPAPSRVTPRDVKPPTETPGAVALPPAARVSAPPGSDKLSLTVGEVVVDGGYPELARETARLTAPVRGRRTTVAELYDLAAAIEQAYARAGFTLVRVNPPPQNLIDGGSVRLAVVDGFIEAVDTSHVHPNIRRPVEMYVRPLVGRRHLRQRMLERQVLLAGQVAGAQLTTALARGRQPGGVILVVNADFDPFSGQASYDNHLGPSFDRRALSVQAALASPFRRGEQVYGFLGADPLRLFDSRSPRRVASVGVSVPLGSSGLMLNPEATISRTYPKPPAFAPATFGSFDRYVLRLTYPVLLARGYDLDAALALEAEDEKQSAYQFGFTLSHDRLRILRASLDGHSEAMGPLALRGRLEVSRGFDGLGARTVEDAVAEQVPFSRLGVRPEFTKLAFDGSVSGPLPLGGSAQLFVRAQAAVDGVMPSSELFALDAPNALSSFDSGATGADAGWTVRLQLGRTFLPTTWGGGHAAITPYVYGAAGGASYETFSPGAITRANDYGVGLDLRIQPPKSAVRPFLALEMGRHHANGLVPDDSRVSVAAGVQF
jgi:hemolysin activation/secretion protein